ncbi:MAG: DUF2911 domain-containing protein [Acidobacteria bacterium]|nr:DUF2911 domain-containing protein [Acidobacteriota bacterium]
MKIRTLLPMLLVLTCASCAQAQNSNMSTPGAATPMAQQTAPGRADAEATIKGKKISINYGRPSLKGRDLLAQAPVGTVWRVGMNAATEIKTAADLMIGDKELKAGKYSLWVRRTGEDAWTLAFHPKTGVWGAPPLKEGYVAELPLKLEKVADSMEMLTISLTDAKGEGEIKIHWGTALMSGKFGVK